MTPLTAGDPLKIVHLITRLNVGGAARHVILLNQNLAARGHRTLLVHGSVGDGESTLEQLASEAHVPTEKIAPLGRILRPLSDARVLLRLLRLLRRERPDVVHTHMSKAGAVGRIAAWMCNATRTKGSRCLVVHTFHGHVLDGYFGSTTNAAVRLAERTLARLTDRIVTLSPLQRRDIVERFAIAPPSKVVVISLCLDLEPLLQLPADAPSYRAEFGLRPEDIVVGFVGRLVPIKDVASLIRAFAAAWRRVPNLYLLIVGDGPLRSELEQLVRENGIAARVRFAGWLADLPRVYATIDICALSSLSEGTPVTLIEAMAAGKAVASTAVGGVPDVVTHEVDGLLVPAQDSPALAAALVRLAEHPDERGRLGRCAKRNVAEAYSTTRLVGEVEAMYRTGLAGKRR